MPQVVRCFRVRWGDTDAAGIVFYPNYFGWFDEGSHELFRHVGYPVTRMASEGYSVPLIEAHGRFLGALAYDEELEIVSRVAEVRTRAVRIEHRVARGTVSVCEGYEVRMWVCLGRAGEPLVPQPWPAELRAALEG